MAHQYEMKGIKNFKGHEGEPLAQGSLYRDGKKVAEWSDDSHGGMMNHRFISRDEENLFAEFAKQYLDGKSNVLGEPYKVADMDPFGLVQECLEQMSYAATEEAELRKQCAKALVFSMKGPDGKPTAEMTTFKLLFTENEVARLLKANPEFDECLNARFGKPMKDGSPEHLEAEKAFYRKDCKTKTMFVKLENGRRAVYSIKHPFSADVAKKLRERHPDLVCILNEVCG